MIGGCEFDVFCFGCSDLREYFDEYYCGSDLMFVFVGDFEVEWVCMLVKKYFELLLFVVVYEVFVCVLVKLIEMFEFVEFCVCVD